MGVPAGRDRDEFDRGILYCAPVREILHRLVPDPSRPACLRNLWQRCPAVCAGMGGAAMLLGDSVLDVSPQNLPPHLNVWAHIPHWLRPLTGRRPHACLTLSLNHVAMQP